MTTPNAPAAPPPQASTIDRALRAGDARAALAASAAWAQASQDAPKQTAVEIAKAVAGVYRDLIADPVHEYVEHAEAMLPPDVGPVVAKAVGRLVAMTKEWEPKLRACYEERLARELRDFLRAKQWSDALANIRALCTPSEAELGSADAIKRRVQYAGAVIGTCVNHPREGEGLIGMVARDPAAYGLTIDLANAMQKARQDRHDQMMRANLDNIENQWSTVLKGTQVDILQKMPGKNLMGDPEEAELRDVGDLFRTVLRVPMWLQRWDMMLDATLVLVDFTPKDLGVAAQSSGIEGRSYANLGFRARKAVAMVFMDIGRNAWFARQYAQWATENLDRPQRTEMVELMGALRCDEYAAVFQQMWLDKRLRDLRPELTVAIANLASPDSAALLLDELKSSLHKSVIDPPAVRKGQQLLEALGRIMRSPRTPDGARRDILARVADTVPRDNVHLATAAVYSVMSAKPEMLSPEQRRNAITSMVESLWIQDQSTEMHKGGERQSNILGARNAAIGALQRLGKEDFEFMLAEFEKRAMRFGGAYMAAAELFEKLKDPRAIPLLANMAMNAAMQDMGKLSTYQRETYWDATAQQRKELGKDQVLAPLVYTLGEIGGPEGMRTLGDLFQRIQAGRTENPGPETMQFLAKYLSRDRGLERGSSPSAAAPDADAGNETGEEHALPPADPGEVDELVKKLTARYFLAGGSKRAQAKIPALARLGQLTPPDAIDAIFDNLTEKEPIIASAALTAAAEYAAHGKPATLVALVVDKALMGIESRDPALRAECSKLLKEIGPNRPEVRKRVAAFAKSVDDPSVKLSLKQFLGEVAPVGGAAPAAPAAEGDGGAEGAPRTSDSSSARPAVAGAGKSALDLKREYMVARQEWIKGGKKGPPPEAPPGA